VQEPFSIAKLIAVVGAPVAAGAASSEVFADEPIRFLVSVVAGVISVVGGLAWLDHRIAKKNKAQTRVLMRELRAFQRLLSVRLGLPELAPPEITDELLLEEGD
jgi:hypothetical protein